MSTGQLAQIQSAQQLRDMTYPQLEQLCAEIRQVLIQTVAQNGGHLSPNLGTVELTVALHRCLQLPQDTLLFDVGHQCYTHKLLTGRYERFGTLRTQGGISGFPNPAESDCDPFIAGHSSTSISAACGFAAAKRLHGDKSCTVAVIGDGALTGGQAYEGLSNVAHQKGRLIVVLNDNRMSIGQNVGFAARHLTWLRSRSKYLRLKNTVAYAVSRIPAVGGWLYRKLFRLKTGLKTVLYRGSSMFEDMGLHYFGPVDGHDLQALCRAMHIAKSIARPVLIHVVTQKGKGYSPATERPDTYHGVSPFDVRCGQPSGTGDTFSSVFGQTLEGLAQQHPSVCAVTAAMTAGTGLQGFAARFPDRFFDVGIAEQHAVTFASALSCGGMTPVVALYSTFLQRAYDQLLNDTAIMHNHVVFAVDRAGLVPGDGETHQGLFDPAFLRSIPDMYLYAPCNFAELRRMLSDAVLHHSGPVAVRYPRGGQPDSLAAYPASGQPFDLTAGESKNILLVTYGDCFASALQARERLQADGVPADLLKLNRIWPLDERAVQCAKGYGAVYFFERAGAAGGIGEGFASALQQQGITCRFTHKAVREWIPCCTAEQAAARTGLDADGMFQTIKEDVPCILP